MTQLQHFSPSVVRVAARARRVFLHTMAAAASVVLLAASAGSLAAQTTLTIGNAIDAFPVSSLGATNSVAIGQTFQVPGVTCGLSCYLQSFSFWLSPSEQPDANSASLQFRAYVAEWDGSNAVSGTVTTVAGTFTGPTVVAQQYQFAAPNFAINPGKVYVAFLSVVGLPVGGSPFADVDGYLGDASPFTSGDLVYTNSGATLTDLTTNAWDYTGDANFQLQTRFAATFTSNVVPEPSSFALLAFGAAGLLFVARRRRI